MKKWMKFLCFIFIIVFIRYAYVKDVERRMEEIAIKVAKNDDPYTSSMDEETQRKIEERIEQEKQEEFENDPSKPLSGIIADFIGYCHAGEKIKSNDPRIQVTALYKSWTKKPSEVVSGWHFIPKDEIVIGEESEFYGIEYEGFKGDVLIIPEEYLMSNYNLFTGYFPPYDENDIYCEIIDSNNYRSRKVLNSSVFADYKNDVLYDIFFIKRTDVIYLVREHVDDVSEKKEFNNDTTQNSYILNNNTGVVHRTWCHKINDILPQNKQEVKEDIDIIKSWGYRECGICFK